MVSEAEYERETPRVRHPIRATPESIGLDVHSTEDIRVVSLETVRISTGLRFHIPDGHYLRVEGRSGLAMAGMLVHGGVVDQDYKGVVSVIVTNVSLTTLHISEGERIAQVILERASLPLMRERGTGALVGCLNPDTTRGERGFGSSGK